MTRNSDRFLSAFNSIEKFLARSRNSQNYVPFKHAVDIAKKSNIIVRRYQDDLLEFSDLRNAIVHERIHPDFVIAEPHDTTVEKIEMIENELNNPKKVIPAFSRDVLKFQVDDSIAALLRVIREKEYSQFPIFNREEFRGLVTENGIVNWLSHHVEEDLISLFDTPIEAVIKHEENRRNYKFISRDDSVYYAEELFKETIKEGKKLYAILITHSGKPNESLLGIITPWDIIDIS